VPPRPAPDVTDPRVAALVAQCRHAVGDGTGARRGFQTLAAEAAGDDDDGMVAALGSNAEACGAASAAAALGRCGRGDAMGAASMLLSWAGALDGAGDPSLALAAAAVSLSLPLNARRGGAGPSDNDGPATSAPAFLRAAATGGLLAAPVSATGAALIDRALRRAGMGGEEHRNWARSARDVWMGRDNATTPGSLDIRAAALARLTLLEANDNDPAAALAMTADGLVPADPAGRHVWLEAAAQSLSVAAWSPALSAAAATTTAATLATTTGDCGDPAAAERRAAALLDRGAIRGRW